MIDKYLQHVVKLKNLLKLATFHEYICMCSRAAQSLCFVRTIRIKRKNSGIHVRTQESRVRLCEMSLCRSCLTGPSFSSR